METAFTRARMGRPVIEPKTKKVLFSDKGLLRPGMKMPLKKVQVFFAPPDRNLLAYALQRAGYNPGPNGGSVKVRITRVHDEVIIEKLGA